MENLKYLSISFVLFKKNKGKKMLVSRCCKSSVHVIHDYYVCNSCHIHCNTIDSSRLDTSSIIFNRLEKDDANDTLRLRKSCKFGQETRAI